MKHSIALDHLLVAVASLQEGDADAAQEALEEAMASEDLDETLAELSEMQDEALASEEEESADEDVMNTVAEALEDEEGVTVASVRGQLIITMAGVRNARQAKRVFKSLASVEDVEEIDPEDVGLEDEAEETITATIDGEHVVVSFDEDGQAEILQLEDKNEELASKSKARRKDRARRRSLPSGGPSEASLDEDYDDEDEEAPVTTASLRGRRKRKTVAQRALASLDLKRISRNRGSL